MLPQPSSPQALFEQSALQTDGVGVRVSVGVGVGVKASVGRLVGYGGTTQR